MRDVRAIVCSDVGELTADIPTARLIIDDSKDATVDFWIVRRASTGRQINGPTASRPPDVMKVTADIDEAVGFNDATNRSISGPKVGHRSVRKLTPQEGDQHEAEQGDEAHSHRTAV